MEYIANINVVQDENNVILLKTKFLNRFSLLNFDNNFITIFGH